MEIKPYNATLGNLLFNNMNNAGVLNNAGELNNPGSTGNTKLEFSEKELLDMITPPTMKPIHKGGQYRIKSRY